ncbi:MAG: polyphosphate kinase 1 [Crocinitomicaceae bacterium]|nr:polyphosphate kinase 1 [Crocinitomicaceae bacterium]
MELYNRELSWLAFNERVLKEAMDESNPLVERFRFLGIYSNNLDEFFRVRVASLRRLIEINKTKVSGYKAGAPALHKEIKKVVLKQQQQFEVIYRKLIAELRQHQVLHITEEHVKGDDIEKVEQYYVDKIRPVIMPVILSSKRKIPHLKDKGIYLAIKMISFSKNKAKYAIIEIPDTISRFKVFKSKSGNVRKLMLIDDIIRTQLDEIFHAFEYDEIKAYTFKITRDAELDVDDDLSKSYIEKMADSVANRSEGDPVRFVYDSAMPQDLLRFLMDKLDLVAGENLIPGGRYHNKKDFMGFPDFDEPDFVYPKVKPTIHPDFKDRNTSIIKKILKKDILLSYPYQSFQHLIDVLREAAIDPKVQSIKINLYRVASNSQIINALIAAIKNGKKVTVVIELLARFDEANNIHWANYLEQAGAKLIFGVQNLKVHSKLILIKRMEGSKPQLIAHVGTGNFHEKTAKIYTDVSLLTSNPKITNEVDKVFKFFKNNIERSSYKHLWVSPFNTRRKINSLINREIKLANAGKEAYIYLKLNNLVDERIIKKLYEASKAGVKITCVIRGICALIPGVKGLSENIEVVSVVGRYLEHTRIIIFGNGGKEEVYISSADWMTRNLDRRIEVTTPIYDEDLKKELKETILKAYNCSSKTRIIDKFQKNKYRKSKTDGNLDAQIETLKYYQSKSQPKN